MLCTYYTEDVHGYDVHIIYVCYTLLIVIRLHANGIICNTEDVSTVCLSYARDMLI